MNDRAGFWDYPMPGFFLQWGAEREAARNPRSSVIVKSSEGSLCGIHPHDWDGSRIELHAREDRPEWKQWKRMT